MEIKCTVKPLGFILRKAGLVSEAQISVALQDQSFCHDLRIGEILALRGWLKQETADFFVQEWDNLLNSQGKFPLGYYLKSAALLNESQINIILQEQGRLGIRFGAMAVLKGWMKQQTMDFFLEHLVSQEQIKSALVGKLSDFHSLQTAQLVITEAFITIPEISLTSEKSTLKKSAKNTSLKTPQNKPSLSQNPQVKSKNSLTQSESEEEYDLAKALDYEFHW